MTDQPEPTGETYDLLLELEDLESLREEMDELDVVTAADLDRLDDTRATALRDTLAEHGLSGLADLGARIAALHRELDAGEERPAP